MTTYKEKRAVSGCSSKLPRRHAGMGLAMTLVIVLFSLTIVAVIFELSTRFNHQFMWARTTYSDQVIAGSYVERAKALILAKALNDKKALHPVLNGGQDWKTYPEVDSSDDLRIYINPSAGNNDPLSPTNVEDRSRLVTMRVYDLTYSPRESLASTMTNDEKATLPSPAALLDMASGGSGEIFDNVGETNTTDTKAPSDGINVKIADLDDLGAYLIQVIIRDKDGKQTRLTEEAFFFALDGEDTP